ncbi:MAG TPA: hypothetical protein VJB70_00470 [Candidatus Paceibacterota bacterium]
MSEFEVVPERIFEVCKQDQLYVRFLDIVCDEETKKWLVESEKQKKPLVVSVFRDVSSFKETDPKLRTLIVAFSSPGISILDVHKAFIGPVEHSFIMQVGGVLWLYLRNVNVGRTEEKWAMRYQLGRNQLVIHSALFSGTTVQLVFMDPEKSKEVWKVAETERAKVVETSSSHA